MRWTIWGTLPYFLGGVAVGIFVDRVLGGPSSSAGLTTVVSAVAAAFALSGPLLQERYRQGHEDYLILRQERQDHAIEIADTTLQWLGNISFRPDTGEWVPGAASELSGLLVIGPGGETRPVVALQYWPYALEHSAADAPIGPAWTHLAEQLRERRDLKSSLDQWSAQRLATAVNAALGPGFEPGTPWLLPPTSPKVFDSKTTLGRLRGPVDTSSFKLETQNFNAGPEGPSGTRHFICYGPEVLIATTQDGILDLEKYRTMYTGLRNDPEFRSRLLKVEDYDKSIGDETREFAETAFAWFERVRGSKKIAGHCELCPGVQD